MGRHRLGVGFLGAPLLIASTTTTLFGITEQVSTWTALAALPIALWELSLGIWLIAKGFTPSPITADLTAASTPRTTRTPLTGNDNLGGQCPGTTPAGR